MYILNECDRFILLTFNSFLLYAKYCGDCVLWTECSCPTMPVQMLKPHCDGIEGRAFERSLGTEDGMNAISVPKGSDRREMISLSAM